MPGGKWWERKQLEKKIRSQTFPPEHIHTEYWCEKCWAPYRSAGEDGVLPSSTYASLIITEAFTASQEYADIPDKSVAGIKKHMAMTVARTGKALCCRLGEEVMSSALDEARRVGSLVKKPG